MTSTYRSPRIRILLWTLRSKSTVMEKVGALLPEEYRKYQKSMESILDELSKNAIKANHKHLLIKKRITGFLTEEGLTPVAEIPARLDQICSDTRQYNEFVSEHPHVLEGLSEELSRILRQEAVWIDLRNNRKSEEDLTPEEEAKLKETNDFREIYREVKGKRVYVEIRGSRTDKNLWVEIINTAPILERDLGRIQDKRNEFRKHREAGTEYEFFLNAMDTSDGGSGLGYATIDTHLSDMGLEPLDALTILSLHSTNIMLNIDLTKMNLDE